MGLGIDAEGSIGTAYLAYHARLMASMAKMLRKNRDAARFAKLGDEAAAAFCRRFVTAEGLIVGNTQTAYVLALHFDLLPGNCGRRRSICW